MHHRFFSSLFPRKCILCKKMLHRREQHLCPQCASQLQPRGAGKTAIPFISGWYTLWTYDESVSPSLLRFKFYARKNYARAYAQNLAPLLNPDSFDVITWVPLSAQRLRVRGYNQSRLIAQHLAQELGREAVPLLEKWQDNPPQSTIGSYAQRKANVLGVYRPYRTAAIAGKRVLLIDDVLTTGATASECARVLLTARASKVILGVVAAVPRMK